VAKHLGCGNFLNQCAARYSARATPRWSRQPSSPTEFGENRLDLLVCGEAAFLSRQKSAADPFKFLRRRIVFSLVSACSISSAISASRSCVSAGHASTRSSASASLLVLMLATISQSVRREIIYRAAGVQERIGAGGARDGVGAGAAAPDCDLG
jgi:hypothetical protein